VEEFFYPSAKCKRDENIKIDPKAQRKRKRERIIFSTQPIHGRHETSVPSQPIPFALDQTA